MKKLLKSSIPLSIYGHFTRTIVGVCLLLLVWIGSFLYYARLNERQQQYHVKATIIEGLWQEEKGDHTLFKAVIAKYLTKGNSILSIKDNSNTLLFSSKIPPVIDTEEQGLSYRIGKGGVYYHYIYSSEMESLMIHIDDFESWNSLLAVAFPFPLMLTTLAILGIIIAQMGAMVHKMLAPMVKLAEFATHVSQGKWMAKIPRIDSTESALLAQSLLMIKRILLREKRLRKQLTLARDHAMRISEAKTRVIRHVIHDIRSPLTSVAGMAETIHKELFGPLGNPKYGEYGKDINTVVSHIVSLVNDLLDIEKIEHGTMRLKEEPVNVQKAIQEALHIIMPQVEAKLLKINTNFNIGKGIFLLSEHKELVRMCINILSNSIKYTAPGKNISIQVKANNAMFDITFHDEGRGIINIEDAVKPFNTLTPEGTDIAGQESSGLGLSLVKKMVEIVHQGRFIIESKVGVGTTITFSFPLSRIVQV